MTLFEEEGVYFFCTCGYSGRSVRCLQHCPINNLGLVIPSLFELHTDIVQRE